MHGPPPFVGKSNAFVAVFVENIMRLRPRIRKCILDINHTTTSVHERAISLADSARQINIAIYLIAFSGFAEINFGCLPWRRNALISLSTTRLITQL